MTAHDDVAMAMRAGEADARALLAEAAAKGDHTPIAAALDDLAATRDWHLTGFVETMARAALHGAASVDTECNRDDDPDGFLQGEAAACELVRAAHRTGNHVWLASALRHLHVLSPAQREGLIDLVARRAAGLP